MPPQEIGVKSVWETRQFSRGLGIYLKGLANATTATNATAAHISGLGAAMNIFFNQTYANGKLVVAALNAITKAATAASKAVAAANTRVLGAQARTPRGRAANQSNIVSPQTAQQAQRASNALRNLSTQARQTGVSLDSLSTKSIALGTAIGTIVGQALIQLGQSLVAFGRKVLEVVTFFEQMDLSIAFYTARSIQATDATVSFNDALAQGEQEAKGLAIWLQRLAVASPFTTRDVAVLFRTSQAYGLTRQEAERLTPLLLDFAAAAGLDRDILERLALAMGQVRARGKLTGEEVRQLGNSGIPIRDILVKALGIANDEFDDLLESGALTSDVVIPAITNALEVFAGAGERVAFGTIGGIVSAFQELQEISIARFFTAVLGSIKKDFQELFAVLNDPKTLAFVEVLGKEIGVRLKAAIDGMVRSVRALVASWNALAPVQQQQIIVFAAATAGVLALTAAFGILTIAVNLLFSPLSLIAITVGFFISEWTSGFQVLGGLTTRVTGVIARALGSLGNVLGTALNNFLNFLSSANEGFVDFASAFVGYGENIGISLARGIRSANSAIVASLRGIGSLLTFWMAPGSPPKIAPDIDKWGKSAMQEFYNAFAEANPETPLNKAGQVIQSQLTDVVVQQQKDLVDQLNAIHPDLNLTLADSLNQATRDAYLQTETAIQDTDGLETAAAEAGIRVSDEFVNSFLSRIPPLARKVSEELQEVLDKIGQGVTLSRAGANAFGSFLNGFQEADFGVLDEVSGVVREFLQGLVDVGEIDEVDLPRLLFGAREAMAQGIADIRKVGQVTQSTLQRIRATAGGASEPVIRLLQAYAPLAQANAQVEATQQRLNDITERYKKIITPLREELERINEVNRLNSEQERILSLQRLIANAGVSNRRRQAAQDQIAQIMAERRVRTLEDERDTAVDAAEEELDVRQKARDELEKQFGTIQAQIQAQLAQIGLYTQEASIIRKLQEEAAKLREKELSDTDLQLKFLELQNEELSDLQAAAKAKYTLEQDSSSELEKQQASIELAEIALRRRNREAEAIKLGIPVAELTKLRDFEVTLDDIGIKKKEALDFGGEGADLQPLVDANAITAEWNKTLESVRDRWDEIKQRIIETATTINDNLPSFLKIFPEETGGEPPIIEFIRRYTGVIIGLAVAINAYKVIARVVGLVAAIRSLMTLGTLGGAAAAGGAAAGAGGAAAAGGGLTGVAAIIAGITSAVVGLGTAALITTGYIIALRAAWEGWASSQVRQFQNNEQVIEDTLGGFGPALATETNKLIENAGVGTDEARRGLAENIVAAATSAIADGFGDEHVVASIGNAVNRSIAEGLIADTPENRAAIATFTANLQSVLNTATSTGEAPKINILTGAEITADPTEDQKKKITTDVVTALNGFATPEALAQFRGVVSGFVSDGLALGMTPAAIETHVFNAFNEGVAAGLVSDTESNRAAVKAYMDGLILQFQKEGEIKSPSALAAREIGVPLGEGILEGISSAFVLGSGGVISTLSQKYLDFKATLDTRLAEIVTAQRRGWTQVKTDAALQTEGLRFDTTTKFETLRLMAINKIGEIKRTVITGFTDMRTASVSQVRLMNLAITELIAGEENSLLATLRLKMLGTENIVPRTLGKNFIEGIAQGITDSQQTLSVAMATALTTALLETANATSSIGGASGQATLASVNEPFGTRFSPQPAQVTAAGGNTYNVTRQYNLNVNSATASQGIINDFAVMRIMDI